MGTTDQDPGPRTERIIKTEEGSNGECGVISTVAGQDEDGTDTSYVRGSRGQGQGKKGQGLKGKG